MKNNATFNYPGSDVYTEILYTEEGIKLLESDSKIIQLLTDLESQGNDVGGARDEVNALLNYVKASRKVKSDMVSHLEYLLECARKS